MNIQLTPQEIHDTKFFIEFYSKIPDEQWCVGRLMSYDGMRHCAAGHLSLFDPISYGQNIKKLEDLFKKLPESLSGGNIVRINDSLYNLDLADKYGYTPKERIVNALKSLLV